MAKKIRVYADRTQIPGEPKLSDVALVQIENYNTPFDILVKQQLDEKEPDLVQTVHFDPSEGGIPIGPVCGAHSTWDGEKCACDPGFVDDGTGNCVPDVPEPPVKGLLYASNDMGKWNNGKKRTVKDKEGDIKANGKGVYTAASGNPELEILGDGVAILRTKGGGNYGRIYICATNINSILQLSFKFISNVKNLSLKLRSRHQEGGSSTHKAGGEGFAISAGDWDSKRENYHNDHKKNGSGKLSSKIENGKWYTTKFTCKDEGKDKIRLMGEIDYNNGKGFVKEMDLVDSGVPACFFDKSLLKENSYFWIRLNSGSGSGTNEVALKDITLTEL